MVLFLTAQELKGRLVHVPAHLRACLQGKKKKIHLRGEPAKTLSSS